MNEHLINPTNAAAIPATVIAAVIMHHDPSIAERFEEPELAAWCAGFIASVRTKAKGRKRGKR